MRTVALDGLSVSAEGLGCWGMSEVYGATDWESSIATIRRAIDLGITFLDTADAYGAGHNEVLVGRAIAGRRDRVQIATKVGIDRSMGSMSLRGEPAYIRRGCEASLLRLGVDVIDLYYLHRPPATNPIEESIGAMAGLVAEGKVRHLGVCEVNPDQLRRAYATHPITAVQSEYSLWTRDPEPEALPTCRRLGVAFVAYSPLGRGFLTGAYKSPDDFDADDTRRFSPRFQGDNFARNLELVEKVRQLAAAHGVTAGQLALAWVLAQGEDIVPIPGTKRRKYMEENAAAVDLSLAEGLVKNLQEIFPPDAAAGERYVPAMKALVNR
jgi:aryl-alcohol dehydrogenase-like predicted oxidoreductase